MTTFIAPNGTVFHHSAGYRGDLHFAPAVGEPSVEVPVDDLVAFVARVVTERQAPGELFEQKRGR
jgi:hypothetical protein